MIIKSLKLVNYRRFERLDLELPENIIGIIGRNGSGKSSIVEAIGWALYGNKINRTDRSDVRSQHVPDNQVCSVEMIFDYGGHEYRIERKLKGKNASIEASVWRDGEDKPAAVQESGVSEFISRLLQLDFPSFTASVFAEQKELDKLSTLRPEDRRQVINRLIDIDRIDRARKAVRADKNQKTGELSGLESAKKDDAALAERHKTLQRLLTDKKQECRERQQSYEQQELDRAQQKKALDEYSVLRDRYNKLNNEIGKLHSRQTEQTRTLGRMQDDLVQIAAAEQELAQLTPRLAAFEGIKKEKQRLDLEQQKQHQKDSLVERKQWLEKDISREQQKAISANAEINEAAGSQEELARLQQRLQRLEQEIHSLQTTLNEKQGDKAAIKKQGQDLKAKLEQIKGLGSNGQCPVCSQRLGDHYESVLTDHQRQLDALRESHQQLEKETQSTQRELDELKRQQQELQTQKEQLGHVVAQAQRAQKQAAESAAQIKELEGQLGQFSEQIQKLGEVSYDAKRHQQINNSYEELLNLKQNESRLQERTSRRQSVGEDIQRMVKSLSDLEADIAAVKGNQDALKYDESEYQRKQETVEAAASSADHKKDEWRKAETEKAVLERDCHATAEEITEQKRLQQQIGVIKETLLYLELLDDYLGRFRLELAGRIRPLIALHASELLALMTNSRYSQIELDQDYNIFIYDGPLSFPIARFSGGEQDLANLCLRIAISRVVAERRGGSPISFIALDEIFGSQDLERRDLILNALGKLAGQFRQIFIITHIEAIRDLLPVLIMVEQADDRCSRVEFI